MDRLLAINRQQFAFFICCVLMVALIYSKFALSVCMIALLVISVFHLDIRPRLRVRFNPDIWENVQRLLHNRAYLAITLFFFLVLFTGLYSSDLGYWSERLRIKLPFLLLPFAFASIPAFSKRQYYGLFYFLLVFCSLSALSVSINYALNYEAINVNMGMGQPVPTPMNHIRYSLLMAFSTLTGVFLCWKKFYWIHPGERWLIGFLTLFLFGFIHVLSVRSGLLVLYLAIIFLALRYSFFQKRYLIGIMVLATMSALPILAYHFIPSFATKVAYVKYDLQQYWAGNSSNYSDAERLISIQTGLEVGQKNLILGVGSGDLKQEVYQIYAERYPELSHPKMPHNQFVSVFAGMGLLGLVIFLFALFFPLFYQKNYRDAIFSAFHLMVFISFMMENTIENSIGVAFYVFFLLLSLNYLSHEKNHQ